MNFENAVDPTREQMEMLSEEGPGGPIHMVNMLNFKEKAEYRDGRATEMTGREAYDLYSSELAVHAAKVGGKIVIGGHVTGLQVGQVEELWDSVLIVKYPNRQAMLTMIMTPEYQKSSAHRGAALAGQLTIEMVVPQD